MTALARGHGGCEYTINHSNHTTTALPQTREGQAVQMIENGMVSGRCFEYTPARIIGTCGCGCGREIVEGGQHIRYDGEWFYEADCLVVVVGASWEVVGEE